MDTNHCARCGKARGTRWEHGDGHCSGTISLTACSQIHDGITGGRAGKIDSPFYIDSGFQRGGFRWGMGSDAKLCWNCNRDLLRHIGKFFLDDCAPAQEEKEMELNAEGQMICKHCNEPITLKTPGEVWVNADPDAYHRKCYLEAVTTPAERAADIRQLHREAALAALSQSNGNAAQNVAFAIAIADEFIRQYNPDAVIAEVVG